LFADPSQAHAGRGGKGAGPRDFSQIYLVIL
jgi:hypothetical protein